MKTAFIYFTALLMSCSAYAVTDDDMDAAEYGPKRSLDEKRRAFGMYVGFGLGSINVKAEDAFEKKVKFKASEAFVGAYWKWIGLEARSGQSLSDETVDLGLNDEGIPVIVKTSIANYRSYYLRLQLQNKVGRIYGLLGKSTISTRTEDVASELASEASASGNAYGIGGGIYVSKRMTFNMEIKSLLESEIDSFVMTSMNLEYRF